MSAPANPAVALRPKFPSAPFRTAPEFFAAYAEESARAASTVEPVEIQRAAAVLLECYKRGGAVFSCGNGGSAAIANHLQCDHLKGVRSGTDLAPRVASLSSNVEVLTAIANDLTYDEVFAYQLQSQARPGDVLVAISSSGRSPNIVPRLAVGAR